AVPLAIVFGWRGALVAFSVATIVLVVPWLRGRHATAVPSERAPLPWRIPLAWVLEGVFALQSIILLRLQRVARRGVCRPRRERDRRRRPRRGDERRRPRRRHRDGARRGDEHADARRRLLDLGGRADGARRRARRNRIVHRPARDARGRRPA